MFTSITRRSNTALLSLPKPSRFISTSRVALAHQGYGSPDPPVTGTDKPSKASTVSPDAGGGNPADKTQEGKGGQANASAAKEKPKIGSQGSDGTNKGPGGDFEKSGAGSPLSGGVDKHAAKIDGPLGKNPKGDTYGSSV